MTYTYDSRGLRESMVDGSGTTSYGYDSLDRLTSKRDGAGHVVGYRYDLGSNVEQVDYPRVLFGDNYLPRAM